MTRGSFIHEVPRDFPRPERLKTKTPSQKSQHKRSRRWHPRRGHDKVSRGLRSYFTSLLSSAEAESVRITSFPGAGYYKYVPVIAEAAESETIPMYGSFTLCPSRPTLPMVPFQSRSLDDIMQRMPSF